ncbi:MAG: hypothetical protein ACYTGZ_20150 [Planctomycetota bacterium]|jgi:hypothetical protein
MRSTIICTAVLSLVLAASLYLAHLSSDHAHPQPIRGSALPKSPRARPEYDWNTFRPGFPTETKSVLTEHFQVEGGGHVPVAYLADVAERAFTFTCNRLGLDAARVGDENVPVFICNNREEMVALETSFGLANASKNPRWGAAVFHRKGPLILILYRPSRIPVSVPHEVVHWVVAHVTTRSPPILSEGLAEYLETEILDSLPGCDGVNGLEADRRNRLLRRVVRAEPRPQLAALFRLRRSEIRDSRHYAAGWALAKVLCERESRRPGKLLKLLESYGGEREKVDPWGLFSTQYPEAEIRRAWWSAMNACASSG